MNKKIVCIMFLLLSFGLFPNTLMATEKPSIATSTSTNKIPAEIKNMIDRINEIKDMDRSSLNRNEKKELRKEVRAMKKTVRASGNGLYISSGAIIIILLLIIIL